MPFGFTTAWPFAGMVAICRVAGSRLFSGSLSLARTLRVTAWAWVVMALSLTAKGAVLVGGWSLSRMVIVAAEMGRVALLALLNCSENWRVPSTVRLPSTGIEMDLMVSPGAKLSVPATAV